MSISQDTRLILSELLLECARIEKQIEIVRLLLCEFEEFHPYTTFKILNQRKGYLDSCDVHDLLKRSGFHVKIEDCNIYIKNYDQNRDFTLSYSEFLRSILPNTNKELRQKISLKQPLSIELDSQVEYTLARMIDKEIHLTLGLEPLKSQLRNQNDYHLIFRKIDQMNSNKIIVKDLQVFFEQSDLLVYKDEIGAMFRRLDTKNDGVVSQEDFYRFLQPLLGKSYQQSPIERSIYDQIEKSPPKSPYISTPQDYLSRILSQSEIKPPIDYYRKASSQKQSFKSSPQKTDQKQNQQERKINLPQKKQLNQGNQIQTPKKYLDHKALIRQEIAQIKQQDSTNKRIKTQSSKSPNQKLKGPLSKQKKSKLNTDRKPQQQTIAKQPQSKKTSRPQKSSKSVKEVYSSILQVILEREHAIEQTKQYLVSQPDFNLFDGFSIMDKERKGYITQRQIDGFLKQNQDLSHPLLQRYGTEGVLRFSEFVRLIEPYSLDYVEVLHRKRENIHIQSDQAFLSADTEQIYINLLNLIIDEVKSMNEIKKQISKFKNLKQSFILIDANKDGYITVSDLNQFFDSEQGYNNVDLLLLVNKLDYDGDGKVNQLDYLQTFNA